MNRRIRQGIQLGMYSLVLACTACGQNSEESAKDGTAQSDIQQNPIKESGMDSSTDGNTMDQYISEAVAELAARTGVASDKITVRDARSVNWGSGAVGCPKPGMNYTQAIVPGLQLLLEADGTIYHFHGRTGSSLSYCPDERVEPPAFGPGKEVM
jgi:hypothetical protein